MTKDILTLLELSEEDIDRLFKRAIELKERHKKGITDRPLIGKTVGLLFDKPSTRTRVSFEVAVAQLGGTPIYLNTNDTQISRGEPVKDVARVLTRYLDALVIRTFSQELVEEFGKYSTIPVINALTDLYHPCQVLSDIMTVVEHKKGYADLNITWIGDGNNVCHSWINAACILGLNLAIACPKGYFPNDKIVENAWAKKRGNIFITSDVEEAIMKSDVVYTDVWTSMGQEKEQEKRKQTFKGFQVNADLLRKASKNVIVMHCLPAHRGEEITEDALESSRSVVWDQSENKLHMHKAILEILMSR